MRIATIMIYNQLARSLKGNLTELTEKSNWLATGKKISKPSDNVLGSIKALDYKLSIDRNEQYQTNMVQANSYLNFNDKVMTQVSDTLAQLKKLTYSGGVAWGTDQDPAYYAKQAESLRDYLLELSNSKFSDRYIYSGFQSDQKAYEYDPATQGYAYQGDSGQLKLPIDRAMNQTINVVGSSNDPAISTAFSYTFPATVSDNLKPVVNTAVNKLDIFTESGGAVPDALNPIKVMIPDGNGYTQRTRDTTYLAGTSQFIMADGTDYWSKGSLDAEIKSAYLYAIWDDDGGIVWALGGDSGFTRVPASTTATDDDFFLLEAGSTYTKVNTDYCVCVGKIGYEYDTADVPEHTIQSTVLNNASLPLNASLPETITLSDGSVVSYIGFSDPVLGKTTFEMNITHPDHPGDPAYEDSFSFSNFIDMANLMNYAFQNLDVDGTSVLTDSQSMNRIKALSIPLEKAEKQVLNVQAELGIRQIHLKDQESRLDAGTLSLQNTLAKTEDADMTETAIEINKITTTLEALRMSSAKILSQSLFDFLT